MSLVIAHSKTKHVQVKQIEYLQRLPLGDVVVRMQELFILCKHLGCIQNKLGI